MEDLFAVFVVAVDEDGLVAMTTRPKGKSESHGLPGGKVDPGESPVEAVLREAKEEGWEVKLETDRPFYVDYVKDRKVAWFRGSIVSELADYKEKHRGIETLRAPLEWVAQSGYKNDLAILKYQSLSRRKPSDYTPG